ncbi:MAG: DUF4011 domain-containing protein, partial [Planctomycetota bacterium]|nr:DUF4011 domain-containing protein [Planctomycetota bacterium]
MTFERYVVEQLPSVEPTMDSVATAFLPLLRQVIAAHQAGTVAPLEGIAQLEFADGRLSFVEGDRKAIRTAPEELRRLESTVSGALELIGVTRRVHHGDKGEQQIRADVGRRGEPLMLPVYLPGYVAWEHEAGHHDPLTDAFSLGLILATLALKLNFNEPDDLLRFVEHRRNLFTLDESLNPVLAQVILRLTELDRGRRPRDLEAVASMLENPGDQTIDLEGELARVPGFDSQDGRSRTQSILARLRDRLFDFSRRNNLLSFRPTLQTVNLTVGSMPLRIDLKGIPENRILVWNDRLQRLFVEGKPIALGRYLNFSEAAYLPSQFDGMIAAARRDNQEFGFAQLRLVACFLSWTNLKRKPVERYLSPLVLLPVQLIRTKGVRDSYSLEPQSSIAEINPIVRRQFQELYGIALPESIDLATGSLDELFRYLADRIMGSEPAVVVSKIDRPRIELIHEKARKRVEQYRRSARISGRGIRSYLDLDYSYDRDNYHPLGLRLFSTLVKRPESHLGAIVDESPDSRQSAVPEPDLKPEPDIVEKERTVVEVQHNVEDNPYLWNFDLCNLTLANFRYRRMSLVQDYEAILQRGLTSSGFESAFATDAPPVVEPPPPIDLSERYDVVASDPTQAAAIALARREESYIIQGPPGTGKSQTITNLIADYVARGKRVLFVCEKRAAIDVVYARLKRAGLGPMCCLIHDSQTDKREFIFNLKETYEECQGRTAARRKIPKRKELLDQIRESLAPMERFQ